MLQIKLFGPVLLVDGGSIVGELLEFSTFNLVRVLNHLLGVPDEVPYRPFTVLRLSPDGRRAEPRASPADLPARHPISGTLRPQASARGDKPVPTGRETRKRSTVLLSTLQEENRYV
ncbi:hypothetical protein [Methanopyrus kandleri]